MFWIPNLNRLFLNQPTHNRKQEVSNHHSQEQVPNHSHDRLWLHVNIFWMVKGLFLLFKSFQECLGQVLVDRSYPAHQDVKCLFSAYRYHEQHLNVDFNYCFTDESWNEELFERDSEMTACYSCQIEQWVWNRSAQQNCYESVLLHVLKYHNLSLLKQCQIRFLFQVLDFIDLLVFKLLLTDFWRVNWLWRVYWRFLLFLFLN